MGEELTWVVLTTGRRSIELLAAVESLSGSVLVVANGVALPVDALPIEVVELPTNVGIPAGRDLGVRRSVAPIVGFLDDDAVASAGIDALIAAEFAADDRVGAVALRIVDEGGETARRHVPRLGGRGAERGGDVALFLGGACAIRRAAYDDAGGYWGELFYGHEELELAWRLIDHGWRIRYLPDATVFHPRTEIGRHDEGWRMTGRNRVMIARRTLPWPVAVVHAVAWLGLGVARAPGRNNRSAYLRGWKAGWAEPVTHVPIRWRTVWQLTRLGRPPLV